MNTNNAIHHLPSSASLQRRLALLLSLVSSPFFLSTPADAQSIVAPVPALINYQGRVTRADGLPIGATGTVAAPIAGITNRKIVFRLWDAATGGNLLWSEEQTVTISTGEFSVLLGQGIVASVNGVNEVRPALDAVFTTLASASNPPGRYLEIMVDEGGGTIDNSDVPISPRQQLTTNAYSFRAKSADSIATGSDLQLKDSTNYGLGFYGPGGGAGHESGIFSQINGPVLYGAAGGALGVLNGVTQTPVLRWNGTGQVGIGAVDLSGDPTSKLVLQGDDSAQPPRQLTIRGNADISKRLHLGYNTTGNYAMLQAYNGGTGTNLYLNYNGGLVSVGSGGLASAGTISGNLSGNVTGNLTGTASYATSANYATSAGSASTASYATVATAASTAGNVTGIVSISNGGTGSSSKNFVDMTTSQTYIAGHKSFYNFVSINGGVSTVPAYPLEVFGSVNKDLGGGFWFAFKTESRIAGGGAHINSIGIKAEGGIQSSLGMYVTSDRRIKKDLKKSETKLDLEMLTKLHVTDYGYVDVTSFGDVRKKGFIAQEVEEIFPQAVNKHDDVVPDIYKSALCKDGWVELATDLKKGEKVRLIAEKTEGIYEVLQVAKGKFRTSFKSAGEKIIVFGRAVKDFRALDYNAISVLNVSATQELARDLEVKAAEVKALQIENADLQTQLKTQDKRLADLEAKDKGRDAKLAMIEKLLLANGKPAAQPVSLKKRTGGAE
jgi:hypothetical protein